MRPFAKLATLFRRKKLDADKPGEMCLHLDQGAPHGWAWLDDLGRDFRYAFRIFAKAPVMAAVIVLSLALGLGANTAVFSWIHTVALDPLPQVRDGAKLVSVEQQSKSGVMQFASRAEWRDLREQTTSFTDLFAQNIGTFTLGGADRDVRLWGQFVSDNFFSALGVQPAVGRFLRPSDDETGSAPVVVISDKLWESRFARRVEAIGTTLRINGQNLTVVGVTPRDFQGGFMALSFDVWFPLTRRNQLYGSMMAADNRAHRVLKLMGRLRPGVSLAQATADVRVVLERLAKAFPDTSRGVGAEVLPHWRSRVGAQVVIVPIVATIQAVTFLLLLVVCVNTANLLLAHATVRSKEIAIRLSLGASRIRIVRQLLAESLLLALLATGLGTLVAFWAIDAINRIPKPAAIPVAISAHIETTELMFSIALAVVCAVVFGLTPALQSTRGDLAAAMKVGGRTSGTSGPRRLQSFLVALEVALALVIVVMAGSFLKSFNNARLFNPGFNPKNVVLGSFDLTGHGYDSPQTLAFERALLARATELPHVESAAIATWVPLDLVFTLPSEFGLEGRTRDPDKPDHTLWYEASRGYLRTLEIGLLAGRDFSDAKETEEYPEAIVNEEFQRRYLSPGQSPIGRHVALHRRNYRIVGVVPTGKYNSLSETPQPLVYLSLSGRAMSRLTLFVRTTEEPTAAFSAVKKVVHDLDPGLSFLENRTLVQHLENALILRRVPAKILGALGPLALFLAATGLYSVLAYAVAQRTHEIGVRMTLGATTGAVVLLVLRQGMLSVAAGMTVGLIAAYAISVRLSSELVQVPAGDPGLFATLPALLAAVALLACWLPARRAAKVDPMTALRAE